MKLTVINTGSVGNSYILDNGRQQLLIECGVRFSEIKQGLKFDLSKVVGCVLTHSHLDHCKGLRDLINNGIDVFCSKGTTDDLAIEVLPPNMKIMEAKKKYKIGEFTVMPFDIQHDVKEPFGFLIHHPDTGLILFATDTYNLKYQFPGVEVMIIEANYDQRVIDEKKENDTLHFGDYRVIKSHMSIQNCIKYIQKTDISKLRGIYLIHLSERNGNRAEFKTMVEKSTGIICEVCKKSDIYDIGNVVNF